MPLIAWAVAAYTAGLLAGFSVPLTLPSVLAGSAAALGALARVRTRGLVPVAIALVFSCAILVANDTRQRDAACLVRANGTTGAVPTDADTRWRVLRSPVPCVALSQATAPPTMLDRWRARAGSNIDALFGGDAPLVRALLIADTRTLSPELRDRFAAAGLVHILSISGLHVAIIAEAVLLLLQALRLSREHARWGALVLTALYVAVIGAPPPALRSAAMLGVTTASKALQRPVSPWAALALGAGLPLVDPHTVTDLGWQLSVAGFAALIAAGLWCRRHLPPELRGWRRSLARDLSVSVLATLVTAPLVAWAFGRVSLVAPLTNVIAAPVVAVLQPALFAAMLLAPLHAAGAFVADAARPLLSALDGVARAGAAVPYASLSVAPTRVAAIAAGAAAVALLVAASSRFPWRALVVASLALLACVWSPLAPTGSGEAELHMIDVGQGDAIAIRTPHGRWMLVDAGRSWTAGDAGRRTVVPYLRRLGGDVVLFVLTHPHADHVGGAATVLRALHPLEYRDAAFAGGSAPYRSSLTTATELGVPWARVHPGESRTVDGVTLTFLAPDSAWTAQLKDPNLASTVALVRFGSVRFLLTGDAEAAEEAWLVSHLAGSLAADVLKVAHHGSGTSSTAAFLDQVRPRIALVSVGGGNAYGHPDGAVVRSLLARGALVLRTDQLGSIVVRTDGSTLRVAAGGHEWPVPPRSR